MGAFESQTTVPALAGDYNQNDVVDAADYVVWRKALGSTVPSFTGADGDGSGIVDQADLVVWRANFGRTSPPVAAARAAAIAAFDEVAHGARLGSITARPAFALATRPAFLADAATTKNITSGISTVIPHPQFTSWRGELLATPLRNGAAGTHPVQSTAAIAAAVSGPAESIAALDLAFELIG
jgi:hypothetical protein